MILILVVLAACISAYFAFRRSPLQAFLTVYLPLLVFIPELYGVTFHGVLINPASAAALVILVAMFTRPGIRWKWHFTDFVVLFYLFESFYGEYQIDRNFSEVGADCVAAAINYLPAYLFGRYLVEHKDGRMLVVRRVVFLLFIIAGLSLYEYRMGMNPFELIYSQLFGMRSYFFQQLRWGFARVGGPFGHAILAGIMFGSVLLLQLWLSSINAWEKKFKKLPWLPGKKTTWITLGLLAGLWMTQSRGPWMGGALGFILYLAGRAKRIRRGITKALVFTAVLFAVFYVVTDRYTDPGDGPVSQDKENAVYRRQLITNYMPVVKAGGLFGYGRDFPTVAGQGSIDNFYLLTALQSGYVGVSVFILMIGMTSLRLLRTAWTARVREDATFALCLLGIIVGIGATVTTVYLGAQTVTLTFLVLGWAQAIELKRDKVPMLAVHAQQPQATTRFAYRRVFN